MKQYKPIFLLAGTILSFPTATKALKLRNELASTVNYQQAINGQVVDGSDNPIANATVSIQGTNKVTLTDSNGRFTLASDGSAITLAVSYVGFTTKTQRVSADVNNVIIQLDNKNDLEEVVVVGYGTQKK